MPGAARLSDISSGHSCFPGRPNDQASTNVFVNSRGWHRQGDHWMQHCCTINPPIINPPPCHDGVLSAGAPHVFVNGKPAGRCGDPISCGDFVATCSPNVFAGNFGSGGGGVHPETWDQATNSWDSETNTWDSI